MSVIGGLLHHGSGPAEPGRDGKFAHSALLKPGWWERDNRIPAELRRA